MASAEPTPEQIAEHQRQVDRFAGVQIVTAGDLVRDVMLVRDSAAAVYQEALGNLPRNFLDPKAPMATVRIIAAHFARLMPHLRTRGIIIRDPADFETSPAQFLIEVVAALAYIDAVLMRQDIARLMASDAAQQQSPPIWRSASDDAAAPGELDDFAEPQTMH